MMSDGPGKGSTFCFSMQMDRELIEEEQKEYHTKESEKRDVADSSNYNSSESSSIASLSSGNPPDFSLLNLMKTEEFNN